MMNIFLYSSRFYVAESGSDNIVRKLKENISDGLISLNALNISVDDNKIVFNGSIFSVFKRLFNPLAMITNGEIDIIDNNGSIIVSYKVDFIKFLLYVFSLSLIIITLSVFDKSLVEFVKNLPFLLVFIVAGNLIITLVRFHSFLKTCIRRSGCAILIGH